MYVCVLFFSIDVGIKYNYDCIHTTTTALTSPDVLAHTLTPYPPSLPPNPLDAVSGPTNVFAHVVLPTTLALMVCNMDRICLSVAILRMSQVYC